MNKTMHNFNFKRQPKKKIKEELLSPRKKGDRSRAVLATNQQTPIQSTLQTPKQTIQPFVSNAAKLHKQDSKISKGGTTTKNISRNISVMTATDQLDQFVGPTQPDSFYSMKHPPSKLTTPKPSSILTEHEQLADQVHDAEAVKPVQQVVI